VIFKGKLVDAKKYFVSVKGLSLSLTRKESLFFTWIDIYLW